MVCSKCLKTLSIDMFRPVRRWCQPCRNAWQTNNRRTTEVGRTACKRYEKTLNGYVMRQYRNMLSRVRGIVKSKAHLYAGLDILPKHEYYKLVLGSETYRKMFAAYRESGWRLSLAPTPNRIDSKQGYLVDNIAFRTHGENSRKGREPQRRSV